MVARRVNLGTTREPLQAGNPIRLDVTAWTNSGAAVGSETVIDLTGNQGLTYALFAMSGDLPVASPSFVLSTDSGISVTSHQGGRFNISISQSLSALWTGHDWHVARFFNNAGQAFDLFDGLIVSTRALAF